MKQSVKKLFISIKTSAGEREKMIKMAIENECNTLVFSLDDDFFITKNRNKKYIKLIKHYTLFIEAGGRDLPLFMPRSLFLFNKELFRMEQGKRKRAPHFCPTNPRTTAIIKEHAAFLITRAMQEITNPIVFHLYPEEGRENTWCQCPACRAFRPAEQYLIAVNSAADVLAKLAPDAKLIYIDFDTEPDAEGINPRANMMTSG